MESIVRPNLFDSKITLLYRWASKYNIPTTLVVVKEISPSSKRPTLSKDASPIQVVYENPLPKIREAVLRGVSIEEIYNTYNRLNNRIDVEAIIALYYLYYATPEGLNRDISEKWEEINAFDSRVRESTTTRFLKPDEIKGLYESWILIFEEEKEDDAEKLDIILNNHDALAQFEDESLDYSPIETTGSVISTNPTLRATSNSREREPSVLDGLDIFNDSRATIYTPYIQYNDSEGKRYYRVLKSDLDYEEIGIIPHAVKTMNPNTIYVTLWLGNSDFEASPEDNLYDSSIYTGMGGIGTGNTSVSSGSFFRVTYDLTTGNLTMNVPNKPQSGIVSDQKEALNRISLGFPSLRLGKLNEMKLRGHFNIYDANIDINSFLYMVLDNELFYTYLYGEEKIRPYAYKHRIDIHFRELLGKIGSQVMINTDSGDQMPLSESNISFSIHNRNDASGTMRKVIERRNGEDVEVEKMKQGQWLHIVINGGVSREFTMHMITVLRVLLRIYLEDRDGIEKYYATLMTPDELDLNNEKYSKTERQVDAPAIASMPGKKVVNRAAKGTQKVRQLKAQIPDLFVDKYADKCQAKDHPAILPPDQVEEWKKQTFYHGREYSRQVLPFPAKNPQFYFVCPEKGSPFPGVKRNDKLSNQDKYPYIPCCFERNQMDSTRYTWYTHYYLGTPPPNKTEKSSKTKTNTIMVAGKVSFVPKAIETSLGYYREVEDMEKGNPDAWFIARMGVPRSVNSFLSCILEAVEYPGYINIRSEAQRENYVSQLRLNIANTTYPDLVKQELYDKTPEEIYAILSNPDLFYDPLLIYRAVEEYFGVNIYIFGLTKRSKIDRGHMLIPRHKVFHSQPTRYNRPTVLILRHWGSSTDNLDYPQCELIIDYNYDKYAVKYFGPNMTRRCHSLITGISTHITWLKHNTRVVSIDQPAVPVYPHENLFSVIDYIDVFRAADGDVNKLVSQYIDPYGKARAFTVRYPIGEVTFVVPPSMPENVPSEKGYATVEAADLFKLMKDSRATARSVDSMDRTDGIWFQSLEITEGIYVPIRPTIRSLPAEYAKLPIGGINPIATYTNESNTERYMRLLRTMNIVEEILIWLYEIYRRDTPRENMDTAYFLRTVLTYDTTWSDQGNGDSSTYYDFKNLPRRLPDVKDLRDATRYLSKRVPQMRKDRFVAYSADFAQKLIKYMKNYASKTKDANVIIPDAIRDYYETSTDFAPRPNNIIIVGSDVMSRWKDDRTIDASKIYDIRNTLDLSITAPLDPHVYVDEDGKIWIIQNPQGGARLAAFAIAINWHNSRTNTGARTLPILEQDIPSHYLYIIGTSGHLVAIEDNAGGRSDYVSIISYGGNRYGALLPLL